jgi:GGDEF domain-containing protein
MQSSRRARPTAEAPIDALLAIADELARRWAIALIRARPLDQIAEIPLGDLAREAPALCACAVRALGSDGELERMLGGGGGLGRDDEGGRDGGGRNGNEDAGPAGRLGVLAGALDPGSAVAAVETLRGVLWEALLDELRDPPARLVADLADRLAYVCSTALTATLAEGFAAPVSEAEADVAVADPGGEERERGTAGHDPDGTQPAVRPAVLIDEQDDGPQIEIRDERGEQGPAAWIGSIGHRLERHEQDGSPFAVLLVELVDVERLRHAESSSELSRLTSQVEEALARASRPADSLTRESPGRYWLLAPQTDGTGARMLADQLAHAVRSSARHRGTPLEVAVGIAVCPDDGRQASVLAAHADVGLYAARAAGRSSIGRPVAS